MKLSALLSTNLTNVALQVKPTPLPSVAYTSKFTVTDRDVFEKHPIAPQVRSGILITDVFKEINFEKYTTPDCIIDEWVRLVLEGNNRDEQAVERVRRAIISGFMTADRTGLNLELVEQMIPKELQPWFIGYIRPKL